MKSILTIMGFFSLLSAANCVSGDGAAPPEPPEVPTIYETFGSNLKMFLDSEDPNEISLTGTHDNELVSVKTNDTSEQTVLSSTIRTIWNGQCYYARPVGNSTTFLQFSSTASAYSWLHDTTAKTIAFRIYVPVGNTGTHILFNNNNNQSTQRGIMCMWVNGSINYRVHKGTSGQLPINFTVAGCSAGSWHNVVIKDTGSNVTINIDGADINNQSNQYTRATGNAGFDMYFFRLAGSGSAFANDVCIKNPMFIDREVTESEFDLIQDYYLPGTLDFGDGGIARVYGLYGQSNASGRAVYSGTPSYFDEPTGAMMWSRTTATPQQTDNWAAHQLGVNASSEGQDEAGPDIEFAYRMNLLAPGTIYILKYANSGSSMKVASFPDKDWYYLSADDDNAWRAFNMQMVFGLKQLKYEQNKDVRIKGFLWRQGESDTASPNDYYKDYFEHLITDKFKAQAEAHGFSVAGCRLVVSSLDMFNATRPDCHVVVDACQDICDNATDYGLAGGHQFTTIGQPTSDGTHFTLAGQIYNGYEMYDYLKDFI